MSQGLTLYKIRYDYTVMLFDDLKINTLVYDGQLYVRVSDLSEHLSRSVQEFVNESGVISHVVTLTEKEKAFIMGLANGMYNVILMLTQSNDEHKLREINTIDELLEKFNESNQ